MSHQSKQFVCDVNVGKPKITNCFDDIQSLSDDLIATARAPHDEIGIPGSSLAGTGPAASVGDRRKSSPWAVRISQFARPISLASRFDQSIRGGVLTDQARLARLGYVSRAWRMQIKNLLRFPPHIQKTFLSLTVTGQDCAAFTERKRRSIARILGWKQQGQMRWMRRINAADAITLCEC